MDIKSYLVPPKTSDVSEAKREMKEIAEYIDEKYEGRIVEIGIGSHDTVARELVKRGFEVVVTDLRPEAKERIDESLNFVTDDITHPNLSVYENASLIYSVRPPLELHREIERVARKEGTDLLIIPLGNEGTPLDHELVNYEGRTIYRVKTEDS